jgi:hypothetical protein
MRKIYFKKVLFFLFLFPVLFVFKAQAQLNPADIAVIGLDSYTAIINHPETFASVTPKDKPDGKVIYLTGIGTTSGDLLSSLGLDEVAIKWADFTIPAVKIFKSAVTSTTPAGTVSPSIATVTSSNLMPLSVTASSANTAGIPFAGCQSDQILICQRDSAPYSHVLVMPTSGLPLQVRQIILRLTA